MSAGMPIFDFICRDYHHFNAAALKHAVFDYQRHIAAGGKMFWSLAGALSTARLGIVLAPAIRQGLIHGISVTGANLEESLLQLIAGDEYRSAFDYRHFTPAVDASFQEQGWARVTDTLIPSSAFDKVAALLRPVWQHAQHTGQRRFWHEYLSEVALKAAKSDKGDHSAKFAQPAEQCWLLAAAEMNIPIVVGGHADSSYGNYFAAQCHLGELSPTIVKSDIEYMMDFYSVYQEQLALGAGCGYMQVGGGIAGDFAMCAVPSLRQDLRRDVPHWAYFCQISDSITSFGSYSGATPNEKITWDKTTAQTPAHIIESDATLVLPLMLEALLEAQANPQAAAATMAADSAAKSAAQV